MGLLGLAIGVGVVALAESGWVRRSEGRPGAGWRLAVAGGIMAACVVVTVVAAIVAF